MATESTTPRLQSLLVQNRKARRRENLWNALKFICVVLLLFWAVGLLYAVKNDEFPKDHLFLLPLMHALMQALATFMVVFAFILHCIITAGLYSLPFLLYCWAGVWGVRQRTIRSLIQTSAETQTPLADMVRAYACDCFSPFFRKRLNRFALMLERGYSLEQAANLDRGLIRYDIVGMLGLGKNDPAMLRTMDQSALEEREFSPIRSLSLFRVTYLLSLVFPFFVVLLFLVTKIIPQFEYIFEDFGTELPPLTASPFHFFSFDGGSGVTILLVFNILFFGALLYIFLKIIQTNAVIWRPPFFRWMFREIDSAKFLRLLAIGLNHQVSLPMVLQTYRSIVPSNFLQRKAVRIEKRIVEGKDWLAVLRKERIISSPETSLLETAQRTGNLTAMLDQIAVSKERSQLRRDDLTSKLLFIPCLMGMAAIVGVFVIGMFLPLVHLIKALT